MRKEISSCRISHSLHNSCLCVKYLTRAKQSVLSDLEGLQKEVSSLESQCDEARLARKEDAREASAEKVFPSLSFSFIIITNLS